MLHRAEQQICCERNLKGYLGNRQTIFPDHGANEIGEGLRKKILKDLGLSD